jgi:hypothetical protein
MSENYVKEQQLPDIGLPFEVESEDGNTYTVDLFRPTLDTVDDLWNTFRKFKILFVDNVPYNLVQFTNMVMDIGTVILTVDDIGIIYITDTRPGIDADGHFLFWDRRTSGRHRVIMRAFEWLMDELNIHKINIDIPVYAFAALQRARKLGLRIEGLRRKAIMHDGRWRDVVEFGVLRDEITDAAIALGKLDRERDEEHWFGLMERDTPLFKKIVSAIDTDELEAVS